MRTIQYTILLALMLACLSLTAKASYGCEAAACSACSASAHLHAVPLNKDRLIYRVLSLPRRAAVALAEGVQRRHERRVSRRHAGYGLGRPLLLRRARFCPQCR